MADFTPDIAEALVSICRESTEEINGVMTRAFDNEYSGATVADAVAYDAASPPEGFDGPGLALVFRCGETSAVAVIPDSTGLVPSWYVEPDVTGKSRLKTLAQELSMLLLPATHIADEYLFAPLAQVAEALARAELVEGAMHVAIGLKQGAKEGNLTVVWPVAKHSELLVKPETAPAAPTESAVKEEQPEDGWDDLSRLPKYCRSFLKVQVPVAVNLATQKHSVQEIRELVPGAMIKFDKSCEELLDLMVCDQPIASGEVVKVGDKFGLRLRNMILPQEQFIAIKATLTQ